MASRLANAPTMQQKQPATKRRSTLAELGIRPMSAISTNSKGPPPAPEPTAAVTRRASTIISTTTTTKPTTTTTRRATKPRPLSMGPTTTSVAVPSSPITTTKPRSARSTTTTASPKRRSLVPSTPDASPSPSRRGSSASNSTNSHKRMSLPATPSTSTSSMLTQQLKDLQKELAKKEQQLEEKEQLIHDLQQLQQSSSEKSSSADEPATPLLSSSSTLIPCVTDTDTTTPFDMDKIKTEYEQEIEQVRKQLHDMEALKVKEHATLEEEISRRVSLELTAQHQKAIDQLEQDHQQKLQEQLQKVESDYEQRIQQLVEEHEKALAGAQQVAKEQLDTAKQEKKEIEAKLKTLETSKSAIHLRRLETQLSENQAAFEEYKRQSQQITDALERRFRDEMQELQSGSDDTANAWLEKHRAQQLEIDHLQATNQDLEYQHAEAMAELGKKHQEDMEALICKCETQEDEMDHQMQQIHTLLAQVEDLQNSLEAATRRLEERASSSSRKVSLEEPMRTENHRICEEKIHSQQLELDELHRRITELRTTHELQMNRLGNEKARELQELQNELKAVHDLLEKTKSEGQERFALLAAQHKKEIHIMHEQYQKVVNVKDRELEDNAYRIKALASVKQNELSFMRKSTNDKIEKLEQEIEGYETRINQFERQTEELQQKYAVCRDENDQLSSLLHQLQGEMQKH
ncbi:hypothetical protein K492DRAFT_174242 [Lichtheimia hyalospora FSU 10163]|nr:hypothetical protein K492DRAFT_174242 [Lichtheimia hyalospora FSU 10163]